MLINDCQFVRSSWSLSLLSRQSPHVLRSRSRSSARRVRRPPQAQALLQTRPGPASRSSRRSWLERAVERSDSSARLRAEGLSGQSARRVSARAAREPDSTSVPGDDVFSAMRALGLADTTMLDSLRGMARRGRRRQGDERLGVHGHADQSGAERLGARRRFDRMLRSNRSDARDVGQRLHDVRPESCFKARRPVRRDTGRSGRRELSLWTRAIGWCSFLTGDVESSYPLEVTRQGFVVVPNVGEVQVANLTHRPARRRALRAAGARVFGRPARRRRATHFSSNVSRVGTNQVIVTGDVVQPNALRRVARRDGDGRAVQGAGAHRERIAAQHPDSARVAHRRRARSLRLSACTATHRTTSAWRTAT